MLKDLLNLIIIIAILHRCKNDEDNEDLSTTVENVEVEDEQTTTVSYTYDECIDTLNDCIDYVIQGYCKNYPEQMKYQCAKSCGFCGNEKTKKLEEESDDESNKAKKVVKINMDKVYKAISDFENHKYHLSVNSNQTIPTQPINESKISKNNKYKEIRERYRGVGERTSIADVYAETGEV